ncbi:Gfo/Idh/MocA family oxidoreductase [Kineococcus glutinatus]|uniref:Gfo/Idh/MocA family oxidoreductase n=1 Tax=Kineococcus glutinatus TaxID=1070872 RepID=A0ABP9H9P0_9ACTN
MTAGTGALPAPRTPDPLAAPPLRWGVLGTGWIAERFTASLRRHTRQRVVAVGARTPQAAAAFAARHGVPRAHGSAEALVRDAGVDVVHVATPHPQHHPHALLALDAGKHVLVEKPLALDAAQGREVAERARERGLLCTEAMWTAFLPRYDVVRQVLADGLLGELRTVVADHGERFGPEHRIMRADLAGGPLLDLGTYCAALAVAVLGPPEEVHAVSSDAPGGVHGQVSAVLRHGAGAHSLLSTTLFSDTPTSAVVAGTAGTLVLPGPFFAPGDVEVRLAGGRVLAHREAATGHDGLHHEAAEVARRIDAGETGSPLWPLERSLAVLEVLDAIRGRTGIAFPGSPATDPATNPGGTGARGTRRDVQPPVRRREDVVP